MARPRQITSELILSTTRRAVMDQGASVSLNEVADRLGVTGPALLKRFGSRRELMLEALMPPARPGFFEDLEKGPDTSSFEGQLIDVLNRMMDFFNENLPCMVALREMGFERDLFKVWKVRSPLQGVQTLSLWLERAIKLGLIQGCNTEHVATAMLGAVSHRAFLAHLFNKRSKDRDQDLYARDLASIFTRALRDSAAPTRKATPRGKA